MRAGGQEVRGRGWLLLKLEVTDCYQRSQLAEWSAGGAVVSVPRGRSGPSEGENLRTQRTQEDFLVVDLRWVQSPSPWRSDWLLVGPASLADVSADPPRSLTLKMDPSDGLPAFSPRSRKTPGPAPSALDLKLLCYSSSVLTNKTAAALYANPSAWLCCQRTSKKRLKKQEK